MATVYKIHPAIGIARVGDSPDEFFVGPERLNEYPNPVGGFKDSQCRVKRQAARFRIFAHHDDGSVEEITDAEADIEWEVHVANRKAAYSGRGNSESAADLDIDPGISKTDGPNQQALFTGGSIHFSGQPEVAVPLGEMRSDSDNRLLVLGGKGKAASPGGNGIGDFWGNAGWYDDIADGPVSAKITLRASSTSPSVEGAWVIVAPPKFAPHQDTYTTLWDRVLQAMVDGGVADSPSETSYTKDVFPLLQRARDTRWVKSVPSAVHAWADPVTDASTRAAIVSRLAPAGNMPALSGSSDVTAIQLAHMERWRDGDYSNDWSGSPPEPDAEVTPDGMDQAALDACVGAAFYPGIEAGGIGASNQPILDIGNYTSAFRIDHASVQPGAISASMALPWQADFYDCDGSWWPIPRPVDVTPQGEASTQLWDRSIGNYIDMVEKWSSLGFVVKQGDEHVEVDRCDTATVNLLTPHLNFLDVPQGPMAMVREVPLAISFEVISPSATLTLEYATGGAPAHAQLVAQNTSVEIAPTGGTSVFTARLWVIFKTGAAPSSIPTQTVTVREPVSGQTWEITIDANTIARETTAVSLVLDRSGSMDEDRGDGTSKHASLQQAAQIFVDVMLEGDGVGLVRYNADAQVVQGVESLGNGMLSDTTRNDIISSLLGNSFDPSGGTSIGDGIYEGRQILNAVSGSYDNKALVVLTDGKENHDRMIADVAPEIEEDTYAIGFGTPENTSAAALQTISNNHDGFLLVTGAITLDNRFMLQKYFLQVLAGVSNAEIVLDPNGELIPGAVHRIPFRLTEADSGVDVILLSSQVESIDFRLQAPNGSLLEPWRALSEPAMHWHLGDGMSFYRIALPTQLRTDHYDQEGTWHALLRIGQPRTKPTKDEQGQGVDSTILHGLHGTSDQRRSGECQPKAVETEEQRRYALANDRQSATLYSPGVSHGGLRSHLPSHNDGKAERRDRIPYSLIVHSYSNLSMQAEMHQSSWEPGARVQLSASLVQSGLPLESEATVWAEWTRPDGSLGKVPLKRIEPGAFEGEFDAMQVGTHRLRLRAFGHSRSGLPFSRERLLTAAVWQGGNQDASAAADPHRGNRAGDTNQWLCGLLDCLLASGGVIDPNLEKRLKESGFHLEHVRRCLERHCGGKHDSTGWSDR